MKTKHLKVGDVEETSIEILSPDYEGITKVLNAFIPLYKLCDDKKVIDRVLEKLSTPPYIVSYPPINIEKMKND